MSNTGTPNKTENQPNQILSQFGSFMNAIVTGTNAQLRATAEQKLSEAKDSNLLLYLECLLQLTLNSSNPSVQQLSIVMFRQSCQPNNTAQSEWNKLPTSAYNVFQNGLLTAMSKETNIQTYLLICDSLGTLASRLTPLGHWQNLLPQLLELVKKPNTFHKQGFLRVLDCLAEYCIAFLKPNFTNIYKVINIAMCDSQSNISVVLQAYKSFVSIVSSIDNFDDLKLWKAMIPNCLNLVNQTLSDEETLRQVLSHTIDLVSRRFELVKPLLDQLLITVVKIARNDNLEFDTRKLAFEMLVVMSTNNAALLRQRKEYMQNMVELSMHYLSKYDDDIDFSVIEDDIDQNYVWNGRQWTNDLCTNLGGQSILSIAQPMIKAGLESAESTANWKRCYAALQFFIQIIKHIKEVKGWAIPMPTDSEQKSSEIQKNENIIWDMLVPKIFGLIGSKCVQIRHSALYLIKTLIIEYESAFCARYHLIFYSAMIAILNTYKTAHLRVLSQCLKCVQWFNKFADISHIQGQSEIILTSLIGIASESNKKYLKCDKLRGHCLTCIGTCAEVMKGSNYFLPFYDKCMPQCMAIIGSEENAQILRGKAMECIGMIGESVGQMRFNADAHKLMKLLLPFHKELVTLKKANDKNKDYQTVHNYMHQLFARISRCIGESFVQYFPFIIPHILESASVEAAQILLPNQSTDISDSNTSVFTVHLRGIGDTKLCINPVSLGEKDTACHMLYQLCKDQCFGFFAYAAQTAKVMKDLMRYQYNARVRAAATTIIPLLLKSVILNAEKVTNNERQIFDELFEPFMSALIGEPDVCESIPILEVLAQIAVIMGNATNEIWRFEDRHLEKISSVCQALLTESQLRIKDRVLNARNEKLVCADFESAERSEWANEVESELFAHIIDVIEYTFKSAKSRFTPFFIENKVGNVCRQILLKNSENNNEKRSPNSQNEILQCICIFIDCLQFGGDRCAHTYLHWFYGEIISKYVCDSDADIRQTCVYAIGVFAKCQYLRKLDANGAYFNQFLTQIKAFPNSESETDLNKYLIYENLVSALGKMIRFEQIPAMQTQNSLDLLTFWIRLLPIENDSEEFDAIAANLLFFASKYWNELIVKSEEMRQRILFCLLFYLAHFKDCQFVQSYDIIDDFALNLDMSDDIPKTAFPVLSVENIRKIKQLRENQFLKKCKAFEKVMQRLQPQQLQNIQFVVAKY